MYFFMLCPLIFVVWLSFFKDAILFFPPAGYTLSWYPNAWAIPAFADGFVISLQVALLASACGVALGVLATLGIIRHRFRGERTVNTLLLSPLLVPGIVAGIAIYLFYLAAENYFDRDIVGSYGGLVIAHVCLTIPWTVRLVSASMVGLDPSIEEAARNLGANGRSLSCALPCPCCGRPSWLRRSSASSFRSKTWNCRCRWLGRAARRCRSRSCNTWNSTWTRPSPRWRRSRSCCWHPHAGDGPLVKLSQVV